MISFHETRERPAARVVASWHPEVAHVAPSNGWTCPEYEILVMLL
jgi:hypothetical protein